MNWYCMWHGLAGSPGSLVNNAPLVDLAGSSITTTIIDTFTYVRNMGGGGGRNMVVAVSAVLYVSYGPD